MTTPPSNTACTNNDDNNNCFNFGDIVRISSLQNKIGTVLRHQQVSSSSSSYEVHIRGFPSTLSFPASDLVALCPCNNNNNHNNSTKYIIKESPLHGRGLFAKCDIKPGEIILRETQMVPYMTEEEVKNIIKSSKKPGEEEEEEEEDVVDLPNAALSRSDHQLLSRLTGGSQHSLPLSEQQASQREPNSLLITTTEMKNIIRFNQFYQAGLNFVAAHANHSCVPNCSFEVDDEFEDGKEGLVFYAIREIKQGEEIFVSYATLRNRSSSYFEKFGFTCKCALCKLPHDKKEKLQQLVNQLYSLKESYLPPPNHQRAEYIAEEAIAICDQLLVEFDLVQVLRIRTSILGEVFQLVAQLDYFTYHHAKNNNNNNNNQKNDDSNCSVVVWHERCSVWLQKFLGEYYGKPGARGGAPTEKYVRIYKIHAHFLKHPDEFAELIESQAFSHVMAGNYEC